MDEIPAIPGARGAGGKWIGGLARWQGMGHERDEFAEFYRASKDSPMVCLMRIRAVIARGLRSAAAAAGRRSTGRCWRER
jgi:hypothetical protein